MYGYVTNPISMVDPLGLEGFFAQVGAWASDNAEKAFEYINSAANYYGGTGQVMAGVALCATLKGCIAGGPLIALGLNSVEEGYTGEDGYIRRAAVGIGGEQMGNLAVDSANIGTSVVGLTRKVVSPDSWRLFRNIDSDDVRQYQTMSRGGLGVEFISGANGVKTAAENFIENSEEQCQ